MFLKKLAIITTHPIQYNAPFFKLLSERDQITIRVFYTWGEAVVKAKFDPGFMRNVNWDIPLLMGYDLVFVKNISKSPGSDHFSGIDNPTLIGEIVDWGAEAILVYGWNFKSHLNVLRHFHGKIPVLFRGDSTIIDNKNNFLKSAIRKLLLKWVYSYIDSALYVGAANKAYFLKHGLKEKQLFFLPHAVENERFEKKMFSDYRNQLGIPDTDVLFLYAGKFEKKKNVKLLLEAFTDIPIKNTSLVLVGNGLCEEELKLFAAGLSPEKKTKIHFLDFQNQGAMPSIYHCCDVFVLPSSGPGETWGLSVNEAMASGKAVLVSDHCGCAMDLVANHVNGYIFESGNRIDLGNKMKLFLQNQNNIKSMGVASQSIIKDWNYKVGCEMLESILNHS